MDLAALERTLAEEASTLGELVASADPSTPVVTCPEWSLAELVHHVGGLYRWSSGLVEHSVGAETWRAALPIAYPPPSADGPTLAEWLAVAAHDAGRIFAGAEPAAPVWAWGHDQHARFWTRRMCFETVVHRVDAALSLGAAAAITGPVAREGIDEHLENLPFTRRFGPALEALRTRPGTLGIVTPEGCWRVRFGHGGPFFDRGEPSALDVTLAGPTDSCYLALLRRVAPGECGTEVTGDDGLLAAFLAALDF